MIIKNISWLLLDKIIRILGGLFIMVWMARYLGPHDFGLFNYALAYVSLFLLFVKLGLDQIIVREIVKRKRLEKYFLGTAFVLKFVGAFAAVGAVALSLLFAGKNSQTTLIIFILSIGYVAQSLDVIDYYYQSAVLSKYVVLARNTAFIASSCLKIYFIVAELGVVYFAIANVVDMILAALFLTIVYRATGNRITHWRFSKKIAISLLRDCWPLAISVFLVTVHMKIDQVMIGNFLDEKQVGIYSIAVRLSEFWIFVPGILVSTLMPYYIRLKNENSELFRIKLLQLYSAMFWMGVIAGVFAILYGEALIIFLFGEEYVLAYKVLIFNIWTGIFVSQAVARGIWIISENLQKYRLYNNVVAVFLNVSMNFILIPLLGITGAAIATLLTQALSTWLFPLFWKPLRMSTMDLIRASNPKYLLSGRY